MAITGHLTVAPEALETQAGQVESIARQLQTSFNQMKQYVAETEYYWKGDAANAHRERYNKNQTSIDEIIRRYEEHVKDLREMAGIYKEAEGRAANMADELPASSLS